MNDKCHTFKVDDGANTGTDQLSEDTQATVTWNDSRLCNRVLSRKQVGAILKGLFRVVKHYTCRSYSRLV